MSITDIYKRYKEGITYILGGAMTTIVNYSVYIVCTRLLGMGYLAGNLSAWIVAVIFAYITNKYFVFQTPWYPARIIKECISFVIGRVASLAIESVILYLFIDILLFNDILVKIISNIVVVVLNYMFAKLFIFQKKEKDDEHG